MATTKNENLPAKAVAPTEAQLPSFLQDRMADDAGKGISNAADDNLVPLVYIIQSNSNRANKRHPDYVEGGEAGAIWLRNSGLPAISGDDGIIFQPCAFTKDWVEWKPNRGGYAGRHAVRPADAVEKNIDPNDPDRMQWIRPNGNIVQETRYHIGNVYHNGQRLPYVIPMTGSGHTVSRGWMTRMKTKAMPGLKGTAPSYACLYHLKTKDTSNAKGDWCTWEINDAGWVLTADDYDAGAELNAAFDTGEKSVDSSMMADTEVGGGSASGDLSDDAAM
jgi:hypothetical protein